MLNKDRIIFVLDALEKKYPDAHCELEHQNNFELIIAVVLSAQTTDKMVNRVTPVLFEKYKDAKSLAEAELEDVVDCIKAIGLAQSKSKNIIGLARELVDKYNGIVPSSYEELLSLPGVGRKTANVVRSVGFDIPSFAVDTHVERICKRLDFCLKEDTPLQVENKMVAIIPENRLNKAHHQFIFFGRYFCKAKNPSCENCPFLNMCKKEEK